MWNLAHKVANTAIKKAIEYKQMNANDYLAQDTVNWIMGIVKELLF